MTFSETVRQAMEDQGISLEALVICTGINRKTLRGILSGAAGRPTHGTMDLICGILSLDEAAMYDILPAPPVTTRRPAPRTPDVPGCGKIVTGKYYDISACDTCEHFGLQPEFDDVPAECEGVCSPWVPDFSACRVRHRCKACAGMK